MRFPNWPRATRLPELGDVALQASCEGAEDWDVVRRAYRVVGLEEGRKPRSFTLVMERVAFETEINELRAGLLAAEQVWSFFNVPRGV